MADELIWGRGDLILGPIEPLPRAMSGKVIKLSQFAQLQRDAASAALELQDVYTCKRVFVDQMGNERRFVFIGLVLLKWRLF